MALAILSVDAHTKTEHFKQCKGLWSCPLYFYKHMQDKRSSAETIQELQTVQTLLPHRCAFHPTHENSPSSELKFWPCRSQLSTLLLNSAGARSLPRCSSFALTSHCTPGLLLPLCCASLHTLHSFSSPQLTNSYFWQAAEAAEGACWCPCQMMFPYKWVSVVTGAIILGDTVPPFMTTISLSEPLTSNSWQEHPVISLFWLCVAGTGYSVSVCCALDTAMWRFQFSSSIAFSAGSDLIAIRMHSWHFKW